MIWLLLSCTGGSAPEGPWTEAAALASTATMGGDRALSAEDYRRTQYAAAAMAEVDTDGSGDLSASELAVILQGQDPLTFDQARPMSALTREKWSKPFAEPALQRTTWELLAFLRAEVAAVAPDAVLPNDDALKAAAATEDLFSAPVQDVLQQLAALHEAHGLTFPPGLLQAASPP